MPRRGVTIAPDDASVRVELGHVSIEVQPVLTFVSRSPDRFWTLLARRKDRMGPDRRLVGRHWLRDEALLRYADDGAHILRVRWGDPNRCDVESYSQLDAPVYSHLNSFCEVLVRRHAELSLTFSPSGETPIEVTPSDYPIGRPARLAYLGPDGLFHVVEARSGEKGPFRSLAAGPLAPDGELRIGLRDRGRLVATLVFSDWARQASTQLSPTAGWGLPQNAIEFRRLGEAPTSPVALWLTLAGTSVGRGYDSVGHAAGVYRNRMRIETVPNEPE